MLSPSLAGVVDAIRRGWLIVVLTGVVGASVAFGLSAAGPTMQKGTAVIAIDDLSIARAASIVDPERVVRALKRPAFAEAISDRTGVSVSEIRAGLGSYLAGVPAEELRVTYTAAEASEAETMARAAGQAALETIAALNAGDRTRQQAVLDACNEALADLQSYPGETASERAENSRTKLSIIQSQSSAAYLLSLHDKAYTFDAPVTVAEAAPQQSVGYAAVGGGILGLALGIGLAIVRSGLTRKV